MIIAWIVVAIAALATWRLFRSPYGQARISDLPALIFCMLAGPRHRRQMRAVMATRRRREQLARGRRRS